VTPLDGGQADQRSARIPAQVRPGLTDPVTGCTRERFERVLTTLCTNARGDVHLDLAELQTVDGREPLDSAAVAALVRAAERLTPPARLVLHNPPDAVIRLLKGTWPDHEERGIVLS
jgi:ABC-type transporter Mla MlaB component